MECNTKAPPTLLQPIPPVCPFARWGVNIIGPLPRARGDLRFATEYFTRWIEAEPVEKVTAATTQKIMWKTIICW